MSVDKDFFRENPTRNYHLREITIDEAGFIMHDEDSARLNRPSKAGDVLYYASCRMLTGPHARHLFEDHPGLDDNEVEASMAYHYYGKKIQ